MSPSSRSRGASANVGGKRGIFKEVLEVYGEVDTMVNGQVALEELQTLNLSPR